MSKDSSAKYYQNNKEKLQEKSPERWKGKWKAKDEKQKLIKYRRNIIKW